MFKDIFRVKEAMQRMNDFYMAPEIQKGLIDKRSISRALDSLRGLRRALTPNLGRCELFYLNMHLFGVF